MHCKEHLDPTVLAKMENYSILPVEIFLLTTHDLELFEGL